MEYLRGALILSVASIVCCQKFIPVLASCRYWDVLKIYSDVGDRCFHCILDQDKVPGIVYTKWTTIPGGYCPIYNRHANQIDSRPCNNSTGKCPSELIRSYQAVAFTGCFQMPIARKSSLMNTEESRNILESDKKDTNAAAEKCEKSMYMNMGLMVPVLLVTLVTLGLAIGYCYKRRNRRHKPTGCNDNTHSLIRTDHTSDWTTACDSSLNNVDHRIIGKNSEENWVNSVNSRSCSEPNLDTTLG